MSVDPSKWRGGASQVQMTPTNWLEIDLGALDSNLRQIRIGIGDSRICAVVKADGYGLGAVPLAKRLVAGGVKLLAVYSPAEARELATAALPCPILMLMPVEQLDRTDMLYRTAVNERLQFTVHCPSQLQAIDAIGRRFGSPIAVHIEIDSGMSRNGMAPDDAVLLVRQIAQLRYVRLVGLFTHPASASTDMSMTNRQITTLDRVIEACGSALPEDTLIHFANTHAMLRDRKYHRSMVRVGLGMLGYGEAAINGSLHGGISDLKPIVRWMSQIVHTRDLPSGTPVGYGSTFTTYRDSRLGVVPVGYADGYPMALSGKAVVRVGKALVPAPVRGAVNMDQIIIDLTEIPEAHLGTSVEVYSADPDAPNALPALAEAARTHCYELLCRLSARITRRYVTSAHAGAAPGHIATR